MEHHGALVGRVDLRNRRIIDLPGGDDTRWRMDDAFIARLHIGRAELRAIVKKYIGMQLERIGQAVGRNRPRLREVTHDFRIIGGGEFEKGRIMRRDRV